MAMVRPKGKAYKIARAVVPGMANQPKVPKYTPNKQNSMSDVEIRSTNAISKKNERWKY